MHRPRSGSRNVLPTKSVPSKAGLRRDEVVVGKDRVGGGIFEREERVGEVIDGVGDAVCPCLGDKDMVATIVKEGRGDVETPNAVMIPRLALRGRVVDHYKLSGGVDAVCREIHGRPVEAVPGGEGRVWSERAQVIEG